MNAIASDKDIDGLIYWMMRERRAKLQEIYERYEQAVAEFKRQAACRRGCISCCTVVGNVDVVTLEGVVLRERISEMPPDLRTEVAGRLKENRLRYERRMQCDCAFLDVEGACIIYDVRPFSCRQLYSIKQCDGAGPTVHRKAVALSRDTVREIQRLDENGYSGHLSYILHLLDGDEFRGVYLSGGFDPARISEFGKSHGIMINRHASR